MSELFKIGLDHEHRITQLESRMDSAEEKEMWTRRVVIVMVLYGTGVTGIVGADKTSDYLASLVKIALKIP